jgi:hypothetical protein
MSKNYDIVAFDGRSRLVRCEPARALRRDFGNALRARYARFLFTAGLLAAHFEGHVAAAEKIYKVVDEEGNVTFTDTSPNDADAIVEPHSILGTNTTPAAATAPENVVKTDQPGAEASYVTRIVSPANESTTPMGPGDFVVGAEVSPSLVSKLQLIPLLDGAAVGAPQSVPRWQLTNVFRGAHRLQVVRVRETGAAQSQSTEHTDYVMRPAVNR